MTLTTYCQKYPLYTEYSPQAQILLRFALRPAVFEMQGCRKSEMHWITPEWP